jgi:hypothetical protein
MRGRGRGVWFAGLVCGLALGVGGCRTERGTMGQDAQPVERGLGGAGHEGYMPQDAEGPTVHGQGLGDVLDAHGYERTREGGLPAGAEPVPRPDAPPAH